MSLLSKIRDWWVRRKIIKWLESSLKRRLTKEEKKMFSNWKTTLLGVVAGLTGGTVTGWTTPDGEIHWAAVAFAVMTAVFGYFTKDHDTTGVGEAAKKG